MSRDIANGFTFWPSICRRIKRQQLTLGNNQFSSTCINNKRVGNTTWDRQYFYQMKWFVTKRLKRVLKIHQISSYSADFTRTIYTLYMADLITGKAFLLPMGTRKSRAQLFTWDTFAELLLVWILRNYRHPWSNKIQMITACSFECL